MWTAIVLTALVLVGSASAREPTDGQNINGARSGYVQSGDCEVTCVIYIARVRVKYGWVLHELADVFLQAKFTNAQYLLPFAKK